MAQPQFTGLNGSMLDFVDDKINKIAPHRLNAGEVCPIDLFL